MECQLCEDNACDFAIKGCGLHRDEYEKKSVEYGGSNYEI